MPGDPHHLDDEHTAETVAPTEVRSAGETTLSSRPPPPLEVMGVGTVDRVRTVLVRGRLTVARIIVRFMMLASFAAVPVVVFAPGDAMAKAVAAIALVVLSLVFGVVIYRTRRRQVGAPARPFAGPLVMLVGASAGVSLNYAFGLFAPLPFAGLMGVLIIFLGVGSSEREARHLYLSAAFAYTVAIALVFFGVLPQVGILHEGHATRRTMLVCFGGNHIALVLSYVVARTTGHYGVVLLRRLDRAVREATRREALLREVRAELEQAAGVGGAGLFTELELGAFTLGEVIGRGGMGEVYAATDRRDGSRAAVKLMRRDAMSDPDAVRRFEREARIVAGLESEHVVHVREVGGLDAPLPFIAMEYLHGEDLAGRLRAAGQLSLEDVSVLVEHCCLGLAAAHALGIVHRDLKPQNLFLHIDEDGRRVWKILDFGVSKLLRGREATLASQRAVGTPAYMSPEQLLGDADVDARTDVYGLSVVVYRALTGAPAFASGPPAVVARAVTETMPEDPARLATLPADIVRVLRIGLAKAPEDRFDSVDAFAEAFGAATRGKLSDTLRSRAAELLAERAWGETPTRTDDDDTGETRRSRLRSALEEPEPA